MLHESPLRAQHTEYLGTLVAWARREVAAGRIDGTVLDEIDVDYLPYGAAEAADGAHELVATYGLVEPEYAAIRKGAALFDQPQRGVVRVRGGDALDFLNRMLTQELKDLQPGMVRPSFWLNRKGRIDADMLVVHADDGFLLLLDRAQTKPTVASLDAFLFAEDVQIEDVSEEYFTFGLHGPEASAVLQEAFTAGEIPPAEVANAGSSVALTWNDCEIHLVQRDLLGVPGYDVICPRLRAADVWRSILAVDERCYEGRRRVRPIGWYALNIARIEAGSPIFNIDFGTTNLPHESGVLHSRVSFRKGCYLGQEVVARMESLGRPKQILAGLRVMEDALPVAGAQVFPAGSEDRANQIGIVTSSTLSPMLGAEPVAFAMIRTKHADEGGRVLVNAEGRQVEATICPLQFWPSPNVQQPAGVT